MILENKNFTIEQKNIYHLKWKQFFGYQNFYQSAFFVCYQHIPLFPVADCVDIQKCIFELDKEEEGCWFIWSRVMCCDESKGFDYDFYRFNGKSRKEVEEWLDNPSDLKKMTVEEISFLNYIIKKEEEEDKIIEKTDPIKFKKLMCEQYAFNPGVMDQFIRYNKRYFLKTSNYFITKSTILV